MTKSAIRLMFIAIDVMQPIIMVVSDSLSPIQQRRRVNGWPNILPS